VSWPPCGPSMITLPSSRFPNGLLIQIFRYICGYGRCVLKTYLAGPCLQKTIYQILIDAMRKSDSRLLGSIVSGVALNLANLLKLQALPFRIREIISLSQPSDPIKDSNLPKIDVAIPCHIKDSEKLSLVIEGVRRCVRNPIGRIILVTPDYFSAHLQEKFPECRVLSDENLLGEEIVQAISKLVPVERRGWITQQVVKFRLAISSDEIATLILDADTILLKPRIWINNESTQILCLATEYHSPYKEHQRKVFGGQSFLLSFVTHHQLMKRESVRAVFGEGGEGLFKWIALGDFSEVSAVSEYDTYGTWMLYNKPNQIRFAKWNNFPIEIDPRKTEYEELKYNYGQYHSISSHS